MRASRRRTGLAGLAAAVLVSGLLAVGTPTAAEPPAGDPAPTTGVERGAGTDRGTWSVLTEAPGRHLVTWRSPVPLPVTDARPELFLAGQQLPAPTLDADGRTLSLVLTGAAPRVADLEARLSGRILDRLEQPARSGGDAPYVAPAPGRDLATDPGAPGPYATQSSDYELSGLAVRGFKAPIERVGHVVLPADRPATAGPAPLVLFLHGRHQPCYGEAAGPDGADWPCPRGMSPVPSERGYDYVQQLLASQGYATVSVAANGINAQDWRAGDGGAEARSLLVRSHLDQWATWVAEGRHDVDLSRVVLVGHSRGGEGVNHASMTIGLDAPYRVVGQVLLAPTAFTRTVASYVPTVTLLPYCDGDVIDLQGQAYTDRARDVADDDPALHSSVLVMGANHNFFNTEWTPGLSAAPASDDGRWVGRQCRRKHESRLSAAEQRAVGRAWIAGAVALTAGGQDDVLAMFDGSDVEVPSAGGADVRSHAVGLGRDLRRPGFEASVDPGAVSNPGVAPLTVSELCQGRIGFGKQTFCGHGASSVAAPHWVEINPWTRGTPTAPAWHLRWEAAGRYAWLDLAGPEAATGWDVSGAEALSLRTVVGAEPGPVRLRAILADGSGQEVAVDLAGAGRLAPFPGRDPLGKLWAQDLRLPLAGVTGIDLADLRRIALQGLSSDGEVWVLDVATVGTEVPEPPAKRLPLIQVDDLRVQEGDAGRTTVGLDYRVLGTLERAASLRVRITDEHAGGRGGSGVTLRRVMVPAGATGGEIELAYDADTRDDLLRRQIGLAVFAEHGAMPTRWAPRVTVIDDDPTPRMTIRPRTRVVAEGERATWIVRLSEPTDYYLSLVGRVVGGAAVPVSTDDVPRRWLRRHASRVPERPVPLHRVRIWMGELLEPGQTRNVLRIPLVRDAVDEGRESVSVRLRVRGRHDFGIGEDGTVVRTIRVRDRADRVAQAVKPRR